MRYRHSRRFLSHTGRARRPLAISLAVAAGILPALAAGQASAGTCVSWSGVQPPSPSTHRNTLSGVAALSPCNAWTVGFTSDGTSGQSLIEHWNGSGWQVVPSPVPAGSTGSELTAVHAVSPSNIWAVGEFNDGSEIRTLILAWKGSAWKIVPSPNPGSANFLSGRRCGIRARCLGGWCLYHGQRKQNPHPALEWLFMEASAERHSGDRRWPDRHADHWSG